MITLDSLVFEYPGQRVLDGLSCRIPEGGITALVGPNGIGKTTLMRCIVALEPPFSGTIHIDGIDTQEDPRACHARIGFLLDFFGLYNDLTVEQCLLFAGGSQGLKEPALSNAVEKTIHLLEFEKRRTQRAGELSRGWRQRLGVGQAIVHEPKILLLDEPASGLDPEARLALSKLLRRLRDEGMTILVSSHILSELEEYSTHMLAMHGPRDIVMESLQTTPSSGNLVGGDGANMVTDHDRRMLRLRFSNLPSDRELSRELTQIPGIFDCSVVGLDAHITLEGGDQEQEQLLRTLINNDFPLLELHNEKRNLQHVYLDRMRRHDREEEVAE
ncbi:MAG: ABC transporter ATP-binding protein [Magnetococcales bacterium]|nr:ABC transporter ATP-binding protein [Magnetococcales bacterium]